MTLAEKRRKLLIARAERARQNVLNHLASYGVIQVFIADGNVTLVYEDGYRWTKPEQEAIFAANIGAIPKRPVILH